MEPAAPRRPEACPPAHLPPTSALRPSTEDRPSLSSFPDSPPKALALLSAQRTPFQACAAKGQLSGPGSPALYMVHRKGCPSPGSCEAATDSWNVRDPCPEPMWALGWIWPAGRSPLVSHSPGRRV